MKTIRLLLFITLISLQGYAQKINFRHIGLNEGLPQLSVMSIWSDDLDQMWFATRRGIFIYDGTQMFPLVMKLENGQSERFLRPQFLCGDKRGNIYFVNDDELINYNKRNNTFRSFGRNMFSLSISGNNLWAGTKRTILYLDSVNQKLLVYSHIKTFPESSITFLLRRSLNNILVGMEDGLLVLDSHKNEKVLLSGVRVNYIFEDKSHAIWVATANGVYVIKADHSIKHYASDPGNTNSLLSNIVRVINQDLEGNIWIGTNSGLNKFDPVHEKFYSYSADNTYNSISQNSIRSIYCDKSGTIWIGSFMGGVNFFNSKSQILKFIGLEPGNIKKPEAISYILPINKNLILFSSFDSGTGLYNNQTNSIKPLTGPNNQPVKIKCGTLNKEAKKIYFVNYTQGLCSYDLQTNTIKPVSFKNINGLDLNSFENMVSYKEKIFIAYPKRILCYNTITNTLEPFHEKELFNRNPKRMIVDSEQRLWVVFLGSEVACVDLRTNKLNLNQQFSHTKNLQQTIRLLNIFEDSKKRIWLTTFGKGLYLLNKKHNRFMEYANEKNGLSSDFCYDIKEGKNGNLIMFESKGLTIIDADKGNFTHFPKEQLPQDKIMTEINDYSVDSESNIYIGTMNGIAMLNQSQLPAEISNSQLFFSHLYLNSEEVVPHDGSKILTQTLPYTSEIRISSKYRSFDIDVSNTNYVKTNGVVKEYILEGFEKQWNKTTSNRIHYTNIESGNYILRVRLVNTSKTIKQKEIALPIEIYPPFYASTYAMILYIILLGVIVWYTLHFFESKRRLKQSLEYELKEKERIEELDKAKVKFYINISHEFRTPISLIKAQIETILENNADLNPTLRNALQRVLKNSDRLQNLVSEILDFRKLELGKMKLKISRCNIIEQLSEAIDTFKDGTDRNGIKLRFETKDKEVYLYLDVKLFMSAINNLLNNAFKFTSEKGEVIVTIENKPDCVLIHFSDTGIGIPEDLIHKVFDRFYQIPNTTTNFGSGIGLSFVKEIVENHEGEITVKNNPNAGCTFTIKFKKGYDHFNASVLETEIIQQNIEEDALLLENEHRDSTISPNEHENTILIVEDNKEMLNLLAEIFSPLYQVKTAEDGEIAIEILKTIQPDLILSDVMMSKVSGIELCSYVKSNYDYCHIPVILLTARNLDENKIEGLQIGADDYIVKPFNTKLLITRCNNIVNNRRILQEKFAKQIEYAPKMVATNESDVKFINQAYQVIENNLSNFDFDVDIFCKEMYMSRVKLYNKIYGITGMTIKDFIQNVKLKKAADYLVNRPDLLITDITYMLGFSSPRYFSKSFKGLFGIIPTEYRLKNNIKVDEDLSESDL